jgi:hypothetical protein
LFVKEKCILYEHSHLGLKSPEISLHFAFSGPSPAMVVSSSAALLFEQGLVRLMWEKICHTFEAGAAYAQILPEISILS